MHRNNNILRFLVLIVLASLAASACAQAASPTMEKQVGEGAMPMEAPVMDTASYTRENSFAGSGVDTQQQAEHLVIKNANLTIVVNDPALSMDAISRLAEELGGFVVNANLYKTQLESGIEVPRASITIRVPADKLNQALEDIKAESKETPLSETINSQDVTSEYTDLQSRLRNLESAEAQLTEIMGSAVKTEDVLNVYNQLVQVREQIEVIKGQIKYYEQSSALSSISVELMANEAVQPLTIGSWQPVGVAKDAIQTLVNTMKFLANVAIWLVLYILPVLLVLYLVFFLPISTIWRRMRPKRKAAITPPPAVLSDNQEK